MRHLLFFLLALCILAPLPSLKLTFEPLSRMYGLSFSQDGTELDVRAEGENVTVRTIRIVHPVRWGLLTYARGEKKWRAWTYEEERFFCRFSSPLTDPLAPLSFALGRVWDGNSAEGSLWYRPMGQRKNNDLLIARRSGGDAPIGAEGRFSLASGPMTGKIQVTKGASFPVSVSLRWKIDFQFAAVSASYGDEAWPLSLSLDFGQEGCAVSGNASAQWGPKPLFGGECRTFRMGWQVRAEKTWEWGKISGEANVRKTVSKKGQSQRWLAYRGNVAWNKIRLSVSCTLKESSLYAWKASVRFLDSCTVSYGSAGWKLSCTIRKEVEWGLLQMTAEAGEGKRARLIFSLTTRR